VRAWRVPGQSRLLARSQCCVAALALHQRTTARGSAPPRQRGTARARRIEPAAACAEHKQRNGLLAMNVAAVLQGGVVRVLRRVFNSAEDSSSGPEDASEALTPADFSFRCGVLWPCFRRR